MDKVKKIGVVVVTHGNYGQSLLDAAMAILGSQDRASAVGIDMSTAVEEILGRIRAAVQAAEAGAGGLILTDMFGGTPTNLSLSLLGTGRLEVITGVNLPMLLKVLSGRERPLGALSAEARDAGCKGIVVAGEVLRSKIAARK